ncbi:MAG: NAD-dependent epimerase/dehydratase family protein [Candidatus Pacearchaeota archaeon]|nr:NAD-dependent epimerase/dehydratase family protein [Candidatus Pacearchaeota archaeon]
MDKKRVLITGGNGFLGKNLVKKLLEDDFDVSLFEERIEQDTDFKEFIKEKDYFFHFAWQTDLEKSMSHPLSDLTTDIGGMLRILEDCKKYNPNIKIIFPSTVTVIGEKNNLPSNEEEKENPISIYDANKLLAEKYLGVYFKNYGVNFTCLRLSNVFGEHQRIDNPKRGILNFMIGKALRNEPLTVHGNGNFLRDYSYVENITDAFITAAKSEKTNGEVYVIGSGEGKSFNEVVSKIKEYAEKIYGTSSEIVHIPSKTHDINKRNFIADSSKFKKMTGWYPKISFDIGLEKTMRFYKNA